MPGVLINSDRQSKLNNMHPTTSFSILPDDKSYKKHTLVQNYEFQESSDSGGPTPEMLVGPKDYIENWTKGQSHLEFY